MMGNRKDHIRVRRQRQRKTNCDITPPSNRRIPRRMTSKGEGGWALWRPQGSRRPDRWPPGRCPFRDTRRIRGLRRPRRTGTHGPAATADRGLRRPDPGTPAESGGLGGAPVALTLVGARVALTLVGARVALTLVVAVESTGEEQAPEGAGEERAPEGAGEEWAPEALARSRR